MCIFADLYPDLSSPNYETGQEAMPEAGAQQPQPTEEQKREWQEELEKVKLDSGIVDV